MLREILAITGRPGLFKIVSQGNKMLIVEDITTHKRTPAHQRERISSLGDVAMYTESEDLPLPEILTRLYAAHEGKTIDVKALAAKTGALAEEFAKVVPDFDRERVYNSDIRKLFTWYNLLVGAGYDTFVEPEQSTEENTEEK